MSRLYAYLDSDIHQQKEQSASEEQSAQINYGSASNSKTAVKVRVFYPKGSNTPVVYVDVPEGLKLEVERLQ